MSKRSSTRQRKKEREQRRRRNRQITMVVVVVVAVIALVGLFLVSNLPAEAPIDADVVDRYAEFQTGADRDGFPLIGNSDAPVSVVEFSSFSCPGCQQFHETVFPNLLERVESGEINFTYIPLLTGSIDNPRGATKTALCAGEQGKFWEMHDVLFEWHETYGNSAFVSNRLTSGVEQLGLNMTAFTDCFNSSRIDDLLVEAQQQGVGSTPTLQINGTTVDSAFDIDDIMATIDQFGPFEDVESGLIGDESTTDSSDDAATDDTESEQTEDAETNVESEASPEATSEAESDADDREEESE